MIVIVCVDDNDGMMFNRRRQSKDRILQKEILNIIGTNKFWMNQYSKKQFTDDSEQIFVDEDFLSKADLHDYCFVENVELSNHVDKIEKIIRFKWNRIYPADTYFSIDLSQWVLEESVDFEGYSHEKITKEIYKR